MSRSNALRHAFLVSASFPIATLLGASPAAAQVTVNSAETSTAVNTRIQAAAAAGRDVSVTVTQDGTVTGPPNLQVAPAGAGKGDGKITFSNAGSIGAVSADGTTVTNTTGVNLFGAGAGTTDNTATASNSKLITGGFSATGFGGDVTLTNAGTVFGGMTASGFGNATLTTAAGSAVRSGNVGATAFQNSKTVTAADGTQTTTVTGGATKIQTDGDVVSTDGKTRGNVTGNGVTDTSVTVNGIAGAVSATTSPTATTVNGPTTAPAAGSTAITAQGSTTYNNGTASATIGTTGDVTSVSANALTTVTTKVSGKDSGNASAAGFGGIADTTNKTTVTQDASGQLAQQTFDNSSLSRGPAATLTIDAGATVGGSGTASGVTSATVSNAGTVTGALSATTSGTKTANSTVNTYSAKVPGQLTGQTSTSSTTQVGGPATVTVGSTGKVGTTAAPANVSASGAAGASIQVAGAVSGSLTAASNANNSTTKSAYTYTAGVLSRQVENDTATPAGGLATINISKGATVGGTVSANGDTGATITNAGTIDTPTTPTSVTATSGRSLQVSSAYDYDYTNNRYNSYAFETKTVGGPTSVTNTADGLISGNVSATGVGDVTLGNAGTVRGTTTGTSTGTDTLSTYSNPITTKTVTGTPPALDVTTTVNPVSSSTTTTQIGGAVTGTYSGVNGTNTSFTPSSAGSITQTGTTASTATVSGTLFGGLSSTAGAVANSVSKDDNTTTTVTDTAGTGTNIYTDKNSFTSTSVAGISTVTISGTVANTVSTGNVASNGSNTSAVAISGNVAGTVSSSGTGIIAQTNTGTTDYAQTLTTGTAVTNTLTQTSSNATTTTGGKATLDLTGTGVIGGTTSVTGNTATANIGSTARIGSAAAPASLTVRAGLIDSTGSSMQTYTRDPATTLVTASNTSTSSSAPALASGDATANVAGTVTGSTSVTAYRGNATANITGTTSNAFATANLASTSSTTTTNYSGKVATGSGGTSFFALTLPPITSQTFTTTTTQYGGKASVLVDSAAALKTAGTAGVSGSVSAFGLGGATATVTAGSIVGGSVTAFSQYANNTSTTTNSFNATGVQTGSTTNGSTTQVGTTAAEVANTGKVNGGVSASALLTNSTTNTTSTNQQNVALRQDVTTVTTTGVGGAAKVTNASGALILGGASLAGATGSFTNNGTILGTTTLGAAIPAYTAVTTTTASTTSAVPVYTAPATLFAQTYTADQNGTSGGFNVIGTTVTVTDPTTATGARALTTSTVKATINLNDGSVTLGPISAQVNPTTGAFLTATTVNLTGSGYLGLDAALPTPNTAAATAIYTPEATLSNDATTYFGTAPVGVTVSGVTALNKTGAGTFVITGVPYTTGAAGVQPSYSLNVGAFNINAGEVQLSVVGGTPLLPGPVFASMGYSQSGGTDTGTNSVLNNFGIKGDVNNNATLVIGRRVPAVASLTTIVGSNLTGNGEHVAGTTLTVAGNYTQGTTGTTVVGITPSLVRAVPLSILPVALATDTLGVPSPLVTIGYFTTVPNAIAAGLYTGASNSRVNVIGNLNLAGNVVADVSRDGLYANGDGGVLFTYTGTADVSKASASGSLTSPFVKFALVNDTTAKTVSLSATRTSYATGATNPNAVSAAQGLDSAISTVVSRIRTDASGGAGFTSAGDIANAQDLANIVSALDWRLSSSQAAEVFNELASGEIYGSLSAVNQNVIFGDTASQLASRRAYGEALGTRLWLTPAGSFATYGRTASGAPELRVNSYGVAGGVDFAYMPTGAFGIGAAYGTHRFDSRGKPETGNADTYTIGAYFTQGFGNLYVNGQFAYGFTKFDINRTLPLLARTINGRFHGHQVDASLEAGYDFDLGGAVLTPFAKAALRAYAMNAFTETGGGGAGLIVAEHDKSIFSPVVGLKIGGTYGDVDAVAVRPFAKGYYTFQGNLDPNRTVTYLGGGNAFVLRGVDPRGYGTVEAGIDASFSSRVNLFAGGGYSFGSGNSAGTARAGVNFKF